MWLYKDCPGLASVSELRSVLVRCGQSLSQSDDIVPTSKLLWPHPPGGPLVPALLTHKCTLKPSAGIRRARGNIRPESYLGEHLDASPYFTVKRWSPRQKNPLAPGQDRGIDGPLLSWMEEERKLLSLDIYSVPDRGLGVVMYFISCDVLRPLFIRPVLDELCSVLYNI